MCILHTFAILLSGCITRSVGELGVGQTPLSPHTLHCPLASQWRRSQSRFKYRVYNYIGIMLRSPDGSGLSPAMGHMLTRTGTVQGPRDGRLVPSGQKSPPAPAMHSTCLHRPGRLGARLKAGVDIPTSGIWESDAIAGTASRAASSALRSWVERSSLSISR